MLRAPPADRNVSGTTLEKPEEAAEEEFWVLLRERL